MDARVEAARLRELYHWYNDNLIPQCFDDHGEVVDQISLDLCKKYRDEICFRIAQADSGIKIKVKVAGTATNRFFGVTRYKFVGFRSIVPPKRPLDSESF